MNNPILQKDINNIMDCFTGVDGGQRYLCLRGVVEALDQKATDGDTIAAECLSCIRKLSRLIDYSSKQK